MSAGMACELTRYSSDYIGQEKAANRVRLSLVRKDRRSQRGFKTADQAAAFQHWADTCGIDWTIEARAQPLPHPGKLPERPIAFGPSPRGR